jgi:hypothetical protein
MKNLNRFADHRRRLAQIVRLFQLINPLHRAQLGELRKKVAVGHR